VSAARQVKSDKQTKQVSGPAKRAALATQPWPRRSDVDTRGQQAYGFRTKIKLKSEIPGKTSFSANGVPLHVILKRRNFR
jgi:hypothetical protein